MDDPAEITRRLRGEGEVLVIAEAGVNHNGSVELAHLLIDAAADAGADAVKFQTFSSERLVSGDAATAQYQQATTGASSQRELIQALELPLDAWIRLASHARDRKLAFVSTAFDLESADLVCSLGVPLLKVPSGELTNLPFIRALARRGLPLLVSTGASDLEEVAQAVDATSAAPFILLMHCVSAYPAPLASVNLRAMTTMARRFNTSVGWSDHTTDSISATLAVALGARAIEKHLTLDRTMAGPDHAASSDPEEFAAYIATIRSAEAALGDGVKRPADVELDVRKAARRSWHATRALASGTRIEPGDVIALRPGSGVSPANQVVGRTLCAPVDAGQPLQAEHLLD